MNEILRLDHIQKYYGNQGNLLDTLTISENIALALTINEVPAERIDGKVQEIAATLNITDILDKYSYQVSGGQKQRCACARAIINKSQTDFGRRTDRSLGQPFLPNAAQYHAEYQ